MFPQWLTQAIMGMILIIPGWLAIPFYSRNFQISSDLFLVWYLLGGALGTFAFGRISFGSMIPSYGIILSIFALGVLICAIANIFIFRSVQLAPNPGLPVAIVNAASVGVFFASAGLGRFMPRFFDQVKTDPIALFGVALTIAGATLIAIRR